MEKTANPILFFFSSLLPLLSSIHEYIAEVNWLCCQIEWSGNLVSAGNLCHKAPRPATLSSASLNLKTRWVYKNLAIAKLLSSPLN